VVVHAAPERVMTRQVGKAFAYVTRGSDLLVFSHVGVPEAGIQVPAGTIDPGETPADAVLRETIEETGWTEFRKPRFLGTASFDMRPYGKDELHERWFFHLELVGAPPRTWRHFERHAEEAPGSAIELELFWTPLDRAESLLIAEHGALLPRLRERLRIAAGVSVQRASIESRAALELITALNAELSALYPEPGANHFRLDPDEVAAGRGAFLVAYHDGRALGCGAVRLIADDEAEVKRMYVAPEARGLGLGAAIVAALEREARALGARRLVLETGVRQGAAIAVYRAAGFAHIDPFGEYVASAATSVCMAKPLDR